MKELPERIHDDTNGLDYVLMDGYYIPALWLTEELKARDQLAWVQHMNSIRSRAEEIIYAELIHIMRLVPVWKKRL